MKLVPEIRIMPPDKMQAKIIDLRKKVASQQTIIDALVNCVLQLMKGPQAPVYAVRAHLEHVVREAEGDSE